MFKLALLFLSSLQIVLAVPEICLDGHSPNNCKQEVSGYPTKNSNEFENLNKVSQSFERPCFDGTKESYSKLCDKYNNGNSPNSDKVNAELENTVKREALHMMSGSRNWVEVVKEKISNLAEAQELLHHGHEHLSMKEIKKNFEKNCSFEKIATNLKCSTESKKTMHAYYEEVGGLSTKELDEKLSKLYTYKRTPVNENKHKLQTAVNPKIFDILDGIATVSYTHLTLPTKA